MQSQALMPLSTPRSSAETVSNPAAPTIPVFVSERSELTKTEDRTERSEGGFPARRLRAAFG
jgi:hypothetical protein